MRKWSTLRSALAVVPVTFSSACMLGLASVQGSGNIITLQLDLSGFTEVSASHGARVNVIPGDTHDVTVRIDDNLEDHIRVEVDGSRLEIGMASRISLGRTHYEVDVTMRDLDGVTASGGSRTNVSGFSIDHPVEVSASGGARVEDELSAANLSLSTSGGSRTELRGDGASVRISSSGGSRANLSGFAAQDVEVSMSGGARADVMATSSLTGRVSGGRVQSR